MGGLIPLADASRRPAHFPIVTLGLILTNFFVFFLELRGGDTFVQQWSVVPADIVSGHRWITILTAMFMHAGWLHIIGNMVFLWAFGPQIEDAMGPVRYVGFYLARRTGRQAWRKSRCCPSPTIPNLGASGAIAAVMGAFIVTYPRDRIPPHLDIFWLFRPHRIYSRRPPDRDLVSHPVFSQVGSVADVQSGGVAYMAHVGGTIFGALTARLFESSRQPAD